MTNTAIAIERVDTKKGRSRFVDLAYRLNADTPNWVPPLRSEARELVDPDRNPFFDHARVAHFLAIRDGVDVGRISAHIDELALAQPAEQGMGPATGNWGLLEAADQTVAEALIAHAEQWLKNEGMTRVLAPLSMSIWEEPGLLVTGHDQPPTVMMGHHDARQQAWVEDSGYSKVKSLLTYELDISTPFPPIIQRIVKSGERNERIVIREPDLAHYERDVRIILGILNDAWSGNWGFVPFTDREIAYSAKKLRPLVRPDLIRIAELEGEPVAFMLTLPDANEAIGKMSGRLFPFGWIRMLRWLKANRVRTMRVPLMGVLKKHQRGRLASQLAFMMISEIREVANRKYGATRGEIGWILDDNQGMVAIAEAIESRVNREYLVYEKSL
ncbi:N-acetyltransferase [Qipengyuania sp. JC766]|uniref:N-acetyltransferase n=1 Tax=Qipengyuania sp. JC766 TaxID=3232139 RepID=UPI003458DD2A